MVTMDKKEIVKKILVEIKPEIKSVINKKNINLINTGLIDSFDIIRIIHEIQKITKRKIDPKKVFPNGRHIHLASGVEMHLFHHFFTFSTHFFSFLRNSFFRALFAI